MNDLRCHSGSVSREDFTADEADLAWLTRCNQRVRNHDTDMLHSYVKDLTGHQMSAHGIDGGLHTSCIHDHRQLTPGVAGYQDDQLYRLRRLSASTASHMSRHCPGPGHRRDHRTPRPTAVVTAEAGRSAVGDRRPAVLTATRPQPHRPEPGTTMTEPTPDAPQVPIHYRPIKGRPSTYRSRAVRVARAAGGSSFGGGDTASEQPTHAPAKKAALVEWHAMTAAERVRAWSDLRNWVTWLHDRYELSTEDRLPHCWAHHPGLIEELWALKIWRDEIYTSGQPGAQGQAARYWHTEMRNLIAAATSFYAAGCRAGHRTGHILATHAASLQESWARAEVTAGIPEPLLHVTAGDTSLRISGETMTAAIGQGRAKPLSAGIPEYVHHDGTWWIVDGQGGWIRVTDDAFTATLDESAGQMAQATEAARRRELARPDRHESHAAGGQQGSRD